ncbi:protein YIPF1 [Nasonia vitripennis]|uniref:Protein YIPF n=1 Tax=Nasonia vitripennis TaxID=7425 RepID=A0A7M7GAR9_NASVI|nr:protein YIPF1 [Nasonia vitripennis]
MSHPGVAFQNVKIVLDDINTHRTVDTMDGNRMNPGDQQFISFQDFPDMNSASSAQVHVDLGTPGQNQQLFGQMQDDPSLQGFPGQKDEKAPKSFWTVEYYQKFFNVSTNDVVERLKRSMIPHGMDNYLISYIRPNPDLYGPFWVCVTLIFAIAISGNLANYFQTASSGNYHWKYDFHIVSYAATCIFLYAWLLPLVLWGALKWSKSQEPTANDELIQNDADIGLLELLCLYGYSLTIYIPVAFLWTIQIGLLQWSLVLVATVLSGGVLIRSLLPIIPGKQKPIYLAVILGMHLVLAAGFMLYFFHVPSTSHPDIIPTPSSTSTTVAPIKISPAQNISAPSKQA